MIYNEDIIKWLIEIDHWSNCMFFVSYIEMGMQFVRMFLRKRGGDKVCIFGLNMSSNDTIGNLIDDPVWSKHELNLIVWI